MTFKGPFSNILAVSNTVNNIANDDEYRIIMFKILITKFKVNNEHL